MKKWGHEHREISWVNHFAQSDPEGLVAFSERYYREQIERAAQKIMQAGTCRILLVSGPSGSTKTTTSEKLSRRLARDGYHSVVISTDNFFVNREDLPLLPNGDTDFESIRTLDLAALHHCFADLLARGEADFPVFDFASGRRAAQTQKIQMDNRSILILEGIHSLNPLVTEGHHPPTGILKLYISPNTNYYTDGKLVLGWRDVRLIRRTVRDYFHRGSQVDATLDMWENVVANEEENIIPYRTDADIVIDSAIAYEPNIYEYYLSRILDESVISAENRPKIDRIMAALDQFVPLEKRYIPKDTVLHEFLDSENNL